jgi:hypothetical protein
MRKRSSNTGPRGIVRWLLFAFALRALVPVGFMPSAERPFSFEVCPDGLPVAVVAALPAAHAGHHHHSQKPDDSSGHAGHNHGSAHADRCPFAMGAAAPTPHVAPWTALAAPAAPLARAVAADASAGARYRAQQPRGPPSLA